MTLPFSHRRRIKLDELRSKSFPELVAIAAAQNIVVQSNLSSWELIQKVLRAAHNAGAQVTVEGVLALQTQGYGMIKGSSSEPPLPSDVYVAPSQIAAHGLQEGGKIFASIRPPHQDESYFAVKDLLAVL